MENQEGSRIIPLIQRYEELRAIKDELAESEKEINEEFKSIQQEIVEAMVDEDVPKQGYQGYTYSPQTVVHYSFRSEEDLLSEGKDKIAIMKANGYADLVKETINQKSLESRMRGDAKSEAGIPDEVQEIISSYDELKVMRRKTQEKTMKTAKDAVSRARNARKGS